MQVADLNKIENPYLLLTPGPLSTTHRVKQQMLRDWCTWDKDYNQIVQQIRNQLVNLATDQPGYTATLMQGSGTFSVEATIGSVIPASGKLVVLVNGEYGRRIAQIANKLGISTLVIDSGELAAVDPQALAKVLQEDAQITHVAMVHCETTTGMLNPLKAIGEIAQEYDKVYIVDAMSSFGGMVIDMAELHIDFLISSANKCIQGVPGFGFILAKHSSMNSIAGLSRSVSLDLYDQWRCMEDNLGKWRFTSPTHVVRAFAEALKELDGEGGVVARQQRYGENQRTLVDGMQRLGFEPLLDAQLQSSIITSFHNPQHPNYNFNTFYEVLKGKGFVIYPGKVSQADCFRIGTIGDVWPSDIDRFIEAVETSMYWNDD
ncbi:MAG: 2-aminoethylphosphonate-pyruvate transaminase [Candidatus Paceibacteria bacterium]|jgi:2-aminoethylphosphonate-pyruvate transaminase|tara:strand:+ start:1812 stop:2936 length:1125 start_codon:yes stop_codon:yes gene_type:complete